MKKTDTKTIVLLIAILISGLISWNLYFKEYRQADTVNIHHFPTAFGAWKSEEIPLTENEYAILETRNAFARKYVSDSGQTVHLFIVYSQSNRKVSHPPEICYTGGGITILDNSRYALAPSFQVNRLFMEQKGVKQIAFYWFKVGNSFTANYWNQQALIAKKTLLGQPASSAMIRLSASVKDGDIAKTEKDMAEFFNVIRPELNKYLP